MLPRRLFIVLTAVAALAAGPVAAGPLHAPSPDWRGQVLYFVLTDRFADGDAGNNDQGAGEYDPADPRRYSGGDLAGLRSRLDYIQGLGATGVWITPPVANQWWDALVGYGGYHGYWAEHFMRVDAHLGDLADYQALSRALHGRGMTLVQDVVVNHVGNFFEIRPGAGDPAGRYRANPGSRPVAAPTQAPFSLNDPRRAADRAAGVYHWTPSIADHGDRAQELGHQLSGLDDLDTASPAVRRALRESYAHWIREAGVDGFRVDTAFYVPEDYFVDFLSSPDPAAPGVLHVARALGKRDFHVFGEGFGIDRPGEEVQARRIDAYQRVPGGLPAMINFPLYGSLGDVFARGAPAAELAFRIESTMRLFADPHRMPTFVDNHDVDRFLAGGDEAGLRQALLAMLTLPGIPVIYYGTEQGFTERRASMFAGGWGSGGRDHFDPSAPLHRFLRDAIALRRGSTLFSHGRPTVLAREAAGPGAVAWRTDHGEAAALVAFNTSTREALLAIDGGLPANARLRPRLSAQGGEAPALAAGADGGLVLRLPPNAGYVWMIEPAPAAADAPTKHAPPRITGARRDDDAGALLLSGVAPGAREVLLVRDGDLSRAQAVPVADGRWSARLGVASLVDPSTPHQARAWVPGVGVSAPWPLAAAPRWRLAANVADPAGDDAGPDGRYAYPQDPGWTDLRPADLRRVRAWTSGGSLRLELTLPGISRAWHPANGFDHVAFTVFLALPGEAGGVQVMPLQNDTLPGGLRWHRRLRAHGWSNLLSAHEGAGPGDEGRRVQPAARIDVDPDAATVTFTLPAEALGDRGDLAGARLLVATWDYDAGFRPLQAAPARMAFSGGDGASDPLWMDRSDVITLGPP